MEKIKFEINKNPKGPNSPKYFVNTEDGYKGIAWDSEEEYQGVKRVGFSIKIYKQVGVVEPAVQVADPVLPSVKADKQYAEITKDAPNPDDIPF